MTDRAVDVLLIGGGVASVRCARALRRLGFDGSVLLVGEERRAPYNRPPLTKELIRGEVPEELVAAEPVAWYARRSIELATETRVTSLDPEARRVALAGGGVIRFTRCLLATGAAPRRLLTPGGAGTALLRTMDDALAIRAAAAGARHAVVIGGGFLGVELAASLAASGTRVTVLELTPQLWAGALGPELTEWGRRTLGAEGVAVRLGVSATAIESDAVLIGPERLEADLVVVSVGVEPRVELAAGAGIACGDGVLTDASQATGAAGVWAAGDVARVAGRRVEHWHAAREGGERAAAAMLGLPVPAARPPWVYTEFAGQLLDVIGSAAANADRAMLGDEAAGQFAVAWVEDGAVTQVAIANGWLPVEEVRSALERGLSMDELRLIPARRDP